MLGTDERVCSPSLLSARPLARPPGRPCLPSSPQCSAHYCHQYHSTLQSCARWAARRMQVRPWEVLAVLPVALGVALASSSDATFVWAGFVCAMLSNLAFSCRGMFSKQVRAVASAGTVPRECCMLYAVLCSLYAAHPRCCIMCAVVYVACCMVFVARCPCAMRVGRRMRCCMLYIAAGHGILHGISKHMLIGCGYRWTSLPTAHCEHSTVQMA
jgi:hypothetical protein